MTEGYRPYLESIESVLEETESSALGLSEEESAKRLESIGHNKLITVLNQRWIHLYFPFAINWETKSLEYRKQNRFKH